MFEPVCQSGESESNDSHADTDSDSDTDGDMYRGLAHCSQCNSGASVHSGMAALSHVPVLWYVPCGVVRMVRHNIGFSRDSWSQGA